MIMQVNSESHEKLNKRKTYIIILSILIYCVAMSSTDIYISSLPQIASDFHCAPKLVNLTISIYNIGIAVAALFIGEISNRYGRKVVLLFGILIFSIAAFLVTIVESMMIIIILRFIQAIACSTMIVIPSLIFKDFMPIKEQVYANTLLLLGLVLATSFAPIVGAYIAAYYTWRGCFALSFILGIILFGVCGMVLLESNVNKLSQFKGINSYLITYQNILRNKNFLIPAIVYSLNIATYFVFIGIASYLYVVTWRIKPEIFAFVYTVMAGAYLTGNLMTQWLNRNNCSLSRIIKVGVGFNLLGVALLVIAFIIHVEQIILITLGFVLIRFASALISPSTQVLLLNQFKQNSAEVLGLNIFCGFIASGAAVYISGVFAASPLNGLITLTLIFSSISILVFFRGIKYFHIH